MNRIIEKPFYEDFIALCATARESIKLCAPYVKADVISSILEASQPGVSVELITKVNLRDFHSKVSDVGSLQQILSRGGHVYNCSNLHAKAYIFDDRQCIVTSANLTNSGLSKNVECGLLSKDLGITRSVLEFYSGIIAREDVGIITSQIITQINRLLTSIPQPPPVEYPHLDLHTLPSTTIPAISTGLSGWKRDVFLQLGQFGETFTSEEVRIMAQQLHPQHPNNHNREAKIRQTLQQLRDLGLVEFVSPGVYKKLWS